jgi:hypothetical protein
MPRQGSRRPLLPAGTALSWSKEGDTAKIVVPAERAALVVSAFVVPITCMLCVWLWQQHPEHGPVSLLIILGFHAATLAVLLLELRRRKKSPVTFCVSASELLVTRSTLLGRSRFRWTRDQIDDVLANAEAVYVVLKGRRPRPIGFQLEGGRGDLKWVAETIRHEMKLLAPMAETRRRGTPRRPFSASDPETVEGGPLRWE